jgi:hypothetical protein
MWLDSTGAGQGPMARSYKYGNTSLYSIKGRVFLDQMRKYQTHKRDPAAYS